MYSEVKQKARLLVDSGNAAVLAERRVGLEKESLRVMANGAISQRDHPEPLGSALTHPFITTDFSEALLEMVTPPCSSAQSALDFLTGIHQFIVDRLPVGEHIWNTSMPCILRGGESVRIGEYGSSHSGQMKHIYRRGLGLRYGRRMQAIAGVHFNFSVPEHSWAVWSALQQAGAGDSLSATGGLDTVPDSAMSAEDVLTRRTKGYFQMMQNLLRIGWVVPYLFGASPAICTSFLAEGEGEELDVWNGHTRYAPYGTSLRMGKIGYRYREDQPIDLSVRHTGIDAYIKDIIGHVTTEHPPYRALGVRDTAGNFQQLSACRLQIENEYYGTVRPKQIPKHGELPIHALMQRGIRYLELRSVDVNLLNPVGLDLDQVAMLEMLMLFAWLGHDEPLHNDAILACSRNVKLVAHEGRRPGLLLEGPSGKLELALWGKAILDALEPLAQWLDSTADSPVYMRSLNAQMAKFADPELTPSACMIAGMKKNGSFFEHAQAVSKVHHDYLKDLARDESLMHELMRLVEQSRVDQAQLEVDSVGRLEDFLNAYLGQISHEAKAT